MPIDPQNPPDQITNPNAAIPIRIVGVSSYTPPTNPENPPDQVTNNSGAIPVYIVSKPV